MELTTHNRGANSGHWTGVLDAGIEHFCRKRNLDDAAFSALREMPFRIYGLEPRTCLVNEGESVDCCQLLISGFTLRQKTTSSGARQIVGIQMPGDFVDIQNFHLDVADHNLQALTRITVGRVPKASLKALMQSRADINLALWRDSLIEASLYREWMLNIGRRDAMTRVTHLLCELAARMRHEKEADQYSYRLPLSQVELADATGLTSVHVNRVLQQLGRVGVIKRDRRDIIIENWPKLVVMGDFRATYLHLSSAH